MYSSCNNLEYSYDLQVFSICSRQHEVTNRVFAEAIRDLTVQWFGEEYPNQKFYDLSLIEQNIENRDQIVSMIYNSNPLAVASAFRLPNQAWEISGVITNQENLGRGLGTTVVENLIEKLLTNNEVSALRSEALTTHSGSQKIFEVLGFVPCGIICGDWPDIFGVNQREGAVKYFKKIDPAVGEHRESYLPKSLVNLVTGICGSAAVDRTFYSPIEVLKRQSNAVAEDLDLGELINKKISIDQSDGLRSAKITLSGYHEFERVQDILLTLFNSDNLHVTIAFDCSDFGGVLTAEELLLNNSTSRLTVSNCGSNLGAVFGSYLPDLDSDQLELQFCHPDLNIDYARIKFAKNSAELAAKIAGTT